MSTPSSPPDPGRTLLISPMCDEGPYLLEWLAWHRTLGFSDILVLSNDCTDGTDVMLDLLAHHGLLTHQRHQPGPGTKPLRCAYRAAQAHDLVQRADWAMALDADEFLVLHLPGGTVPHLLQAIGQDTWGIALHWKVFGDNGFAQWQDRLIHRAFTRCAPARHAANKRVKSIYRDPWKFERLRSHAPSGLTERWDGRFFWVNSAGGRLPTARELRTGLFTSTREAKIVHALGQVNHYVLRSAESYGLRQARRQRTSGSLTRYDDAFHTLYNRNEEADTSAHNANPGFEAEYAALTAIPGLMRLHHLACARTVAALAELRGAEAAEDPRYRWHMERAG